MVLRRHVGYGRVSISRLKARITGQRYGTARPVDPVIPNPESLTE